MCSQVSLINNTRALRVVILAGILSIFSSLCLAENHLPKAPSELIFGARADAPPLSYKEGENWRGYSIDLCNLIYAKYLEDYANHPDVKAADPDQVSRNQPNFVAVSAPERMDVMKKGAIDILCGATTVTIGRMKHVNFTLLTFISGASIMKKKTTDSSILQNTAKNDGAGAKITYVGCNEGMAFLDCTTTDNYVTNRLGSAITPLPKQDHDQAFEALKKDEAQFYFGDRVILESRLRTLSKDASEYEIAPSFLTFEPYAIAIAKRNDLLLHSANSTLARLYRDADKESGINGIYFNHFNNEQSDMLKTMYRLQALPK